MVQLSFHHTGLLVESIEEVLEHYGLIFGKESISKIYHVSSQKVKVCFVKNGSESFLELVEPDGEDSPVFNMLKKRLGYYHLAYLVSDINKAILFLEELNYKTLSVFSSEAFDNRKCAFLYTPEGHLVELVERD